MALYESERIPLAEGLSVDFVLETSSAKFTLYFYMFRGNAEVSNDPAEVPD